MSTLTVATVKSNSSSPPVFQNTSGTEVGTLCRAWINFDGTGTVAIRAQFNVSSITDNGTGDYTLNFATAMSDTSYAVLGTNSGTTSPNRAVAHAIDTSVVAGNVRVKSFSTSSSVLTDEPRIYVAIFR